MNPLSSGSVSSLQPGDRVRLRKPHPCGGREWQVLHTGGGGGAEVSLKCLTCGRAVLLPRDELTRRWVTHEPKESTFPESSQPDADSASTA